MKSKISHANKIINRQYFNKLLLNVINILNTELCPKIYLVTF